MPRESMTMYAPPYALRITTQSRGTVAAAYACTSSAPWRIMPAPLEVAAGLEAGRVDERDDRQVERRRTTRRTGRPCATPRCRACPARCAGWFATTPIGRPSSAAERGHEVRRVARRAARGASRRRATSSITARTSYDARRRGRDRVAAAIARRGRADRRRSPARRIGEVVVGEVRRGCAASASRAVDLVGDDERGDARCGGRARALPPSSARETRIAGEVGRPSRARSRTRTRRRSSRPGRSSPSASAGPDTHAPVTASSVGTDARDRDELAREPAPRVQRGDAFAQLGARGVELADERDLRARPASCTARSTVAPPPTPIAPWCLPPAMRNHTTRRPSISRSSADAARVGARADRRGPRGGVSVTRRARRSAWRCARRSRTSSTAPGAGATRARRARDDVELDVVADAARGSRSAAPTPSRIASRHATASVAPAAPTRWPVTPLVDVTGGAASPNTLRIASASAASLSGVDVPCAFT